MSFRTNRQTGNVFPTRLTAPSGVKAFDRFLRIKNSQNRAEWRPVNGYPNWDTWETAIILENDQRSYRWLREWGKAWAKKMKSGRFNKEAAEYAVWKYIVPAARGQGRAHDWRAGRTWDENMRPYYEDAFVSDSEIDRDNVDYSYIVDRINEDWAEKVAYETEHPGMKG